MHEVQRPTAQPPADFRVGDWLAQPSLNRLTSGETTLHLRPQLMDVLVSFARHQGQVVSKDTLLAEVWSDRYVTESGIIRCVAEIRQLLGDDSHEPRYIETFSKRGYRLVATVEWLPTAPGPNGVPANGPGVVPHVSGAAAAAEPAPDVARADGQPRSRLWRWWLVASLALALLAIVLVPVTRRTRAVPLTGRDMVVLAFENLTKDRVFDDTLPLALAVQLDQSPFLRLLPDERVRETLRLMTRPPDTPVTRAIGMEVCERAGATALVVASIAMLGEHYVIGLEAVACAGAGTLARQQVEVPSKDDVLKGIGQVAADLRSRLGESLTSVERFNVPPTEATTASLDALRAARLGDAARRSGRTAEALTLYRRAVSLDPEFAIAQARLGSAALAAHFENEGLEAILKAHALRDRVTLPERLEIDALYHTCITGDLDEVTRALETMRRTYPNSASGLRGLADHYRRLGRYDEALSEALAAQRIDPNGSGTLTVLAWAYLCLNRLAEAQATAESAVALGVDNEALHTVLLQVGFHRGDADLIARERAWATHHPEATPWFLESEAEESVWRGRLRESLEYLRRYEAWAMERGAEQRGVVLRLRMARYEALSGRVADAMARVDRELAANPDPHLKIEALKVVVSAGEMTRTARLIGELDRAGWPRAAQPDAGFMTAYRAALETGRGHPDRALELLRPLGPFELGASWGFIPLYERGRAHLARGDHAAALEAFRKMLAHPAVSSGQKLLPLAQLGVGRALAAGGQVAESRQAYETFFALWKDADAGLPLLAQARREYARLPGP